MVILGFAGFGWVLGGFGGFWFVGLVGWLVGVVVWLVLCGVYCTCMGRKRGFVWAFWWEKRAGWGVGGKFASGIVQLWKICPLFKIARKFVHFSK